MVYLGTFRKNNVSSPFKLNLTLLSRVPMQKDILMDKMKSSHVENHNMIEVCLTHCHQAERLFEFERRSGKMEFSIIKKKKNHKKNTNST